MIKIKNVLIIAALLQGCAWNESTNSLSSVDSTNKVSVKIARKTSVEDFDSFFKKFDSDSVFQRSRIQFPLKYEIYGDEGESNVVKYLANDEIYHIGINKLTEPKMINKIIKTDTSKIKVRFSVEDTGFGKDLFFIVKNKKWFLTEVVDFSN